MSSSVSSPPPEYVFPPPEITYVDIKDSHHKFPVNRIYCVGRNYADHAIEMGGDPDREEPCFFSKPRDCVVVNSSSRPSKINYPLFTNNLHYEVELVIAIGKEGVQIPFVNEEDIITKYVFGYAVGIDLTRRDLQSEAKKNGKPWDCAKGFDQSAPIGPITRIGSESTFQIKDSEISLYVNQTRKQKGTIGEMIYSIPEIISLLSHQFILKPGDLIFTGTPAGVGKLIKGDIVQANIEGLSSIEIEIV